MALSLLFASAVLPPVAVTWGGKRDYGSTVVHKPQGGGNQVHRSHKGNGEHRGKSLHPGAPVHKHGPADPTGPEVKVVTQSGEPTVPVKTATEEASCDSKWCNCNACGQTPDTAQASCNLCSQKWLFVFSLGGRTASTSILEGLNALPGVSLNGENHAVLKDLRSAYMKVKDLVHSNEVGERAAFALPNATGVLEKSLCTQQEFVATLSGGSPGDIRGFKELITLPSLLKDPKQDEHFTLADPVRTPLPCFASVPGPFLYFIAPSCLPSDPSPRVRPVAPSSGRAGSSSWRSSSLAHASS